MDHRTNRNSTSSMSPSVTSVVQAIFVVNKHAKTALDPKYLYHLKRTSINKLLQEGKAKKLGLHFSDNPRNSAQQSDLIIQCEEYIFHLPPSKEDLKNLPHLGSRTASARNPKASLSLSKAKQILQTYTGIKEEKETENAPRNTRRKRMHDKSFHNNFPSTFLGKGFKW
ncbi:YkyB family protein [Peribacillus sp. SCS-155]|uniref:YkyB family protein n=1 Tax=Peribacillus sedimenti TaxID=3115297 RepID=UPI00390667BF